jgi:hypothetical protein
MPFGDNISTADARTIIDNYQQIKSASLEIIGESLNEKHLTEAWEYYSTDPDAFIFDIDLAVEYLNEVKASGQADTLLLMKAIMNGKATLVLAGARNEDGKFRVVPDSNGNEREQPNHTSRSNIII